MKSITLIVKADVQGSVEAIRDALLKLSTEEVEVEITINDLIIQSTNVVNNTLQISATPKSNDLVSLRETYITMGIDNSVITVVEDTISSGSNLSGTGVIPESSY